MFEVVYGFFFSIYTQAAGIYAYQGKVNLQDLLAANSVDFWINKTGARQYTRAVLSIFAETHSTHPISAYIFLLSPTLGLPPRFIDALFGAHITGISGWNL